MHFSHFHIYISNKYTRKKTQTDHFPRTIPTNASIVFLIEGVSIQTTLAGVFTVTKVNAKLEVPAQAVFAPDFIWKTYIYCCLREKRDNIYQQKTGQTLYCF